MLTNSISSESEAVRVKSQASWTEGGPYLRWPDFGRVDRWGQAEGDRQRGAGINSESPQQTWVKFPHMYQK